MTVTKLDSDIGFIDFEIGDKTVRVDLYRLNDALIDSTKSLPEDAPGAQRFDAIKAACESCELTIPNARVGEQVQEAVFKRMAELRKKDQEPLSA